MDNLIPIIICVAFLAGILAMAIFLIRAIIWRTSGVGTRSLGIGVAAALLTALCILALVYVSAWAEMRQMIGLGGTIPSRLEYDLSMLSRQLDEFKGQKGHYPATLSELPDMRELRDPWGNRYDYHKTGDGYRLMSFGRDGAPGGVGLDADIDAANLDENSGHPLIPEPTLPQFLFDAVGSGVLFRVALFASICAGLAAYLASGPGEGQPVFWRALAQTVVVSAIGSLIVSFFLLSIYLLGSEH